MSLAIETVEDPEPHDVQRLIDRLVDWNLTVAPPEDHRKLAVFGTYDFQSLGFYTRLGYTQFAALEDYPPGHTRHFLRKALP